ncbi:MAG: hypothetical protein LC637_11215, partial [Xanthomonadaceae bacterium]|nr:hypothetical protein [Xanthomonadaceae bacterium]
MRPPVRVLFLTRYPESGASSRYRVYQYLPHFRSLGVEATVQSFMDEPMYRLSFARGRLLAKLLAAVRATLRRLWALRDVGRFDIVYMQRELLPFGPPWIERWMKRRGVRLFFDLDDALFIAKPSRFNPIATLLRAPGKVSELFGLVDCVVAGNDWLRDRAIAAGGRAVTVEVAEDTDRIPMHAQHDNRQPVTIGWLGSTSTVKYLHEIGPILRSIAEDYPDVRFELVGGGEFNMPGVA